MNTLMCYKQLPVWDCETLLTALREECNAQDGTWTRLAVLQGELTLTILSEHDEAISTHRISPQLSSPYIEPQQRYRVEACSDDMLCQLSFYCRPDDYFHQKYGLTRTHSEVVDALRNLDSGKALDLGCGRGRNALYLHQKGWNVTAWDKSSESIRALNEIIAQEHLEEIRAREHDINLADIDDAYDMILSTVVFMFLRPFPHTGHYPEYAATDPRRRVQPNCRGDVDRGLSLPAALFIYVPRGRAAPLLRGVGGGEIQSGYRRVA